MEAGSDTYFNALLDAAVDAVVVIDSQGVIELFSKAAEEMFGYAAAEAVGHRVEMLMPEPYASAHSGYIERYLDTREAHVIGIGREVSAKRKDGTAFPVGLSLGETVVDGRRRFVGIIRDITAAQAAERTLRLQQESLRLLFERAPTGTVTLDTQGRMTRVNQAFCELLGHPSEALIGHSVEEFVDPGDCDALHAARTRAFSGTESAEPLDIRLRHASDREIYVRAHAGTVQEPGGPPMVLVLQFLDRTEQVRLQARMRQQQADLEHMDRLSLMGEMVSGIAHEINQPLGAIATYTQASLRLLRKGERSERLEETLDKVRMQAIRAAEVIRRMRSFTRKREQTLEAVSLSTLMQEVVQLAEVDARAHGLRIQLGLDSKPLMVMGDPVQLQQVFLNLIRNALEATEEAGGSSVRLETEAREDEHAEVRVIDHGDGISAALASKIFDPFFTTKESGMGVGLSISRSIVIELGGSLDFENNVEDGVTFRVVLPTAVEEAQGA
jgi:two-component system sensor kinase FixL